MCDQDSYVVLGPHEFRRLALVSAVARVHGARVELEDNRPGLRACLVFKDADDSDRLA